MLQLSVAQDTNVDQAESDAARGDEIGRRLSQVLDGSAELVDGPQSISQVRATLAARGK